MVQLFPVCFPNIRGYSLKANHKNTSLLIKIDIPWLVRQTVHLLRPWSAVTHSRLSSAHQRRIWGESCQQLYLDSLIQQKGWPSQKSRGACDSSTHSHTQIQLSSSSPSSFDQVFTLSLSGQMLSTYIQVEADLFLFFSLYKRFRNMPIQKNCEGSRVVERVWTLCEQTSVKSIDYPRVGRQVTGSLWSLLYSSEEVGVHGTCLVSDFQMHMKYLGILLDCRLWLSNQSGVRPKRLHF